MFKLIFLFIPLFKHFKGTEENQHREQKMTGECCTGLQGAHGCLYSLDPLQSRRAEHRGAHRKEERAGEEAVGPVFTEMKPMRDYAEEAISQSQQH